MKNKKARRPKKKSRGAKKIKTSRRGGTKKLARHTAPRRAKKVKAKKFAKIVAPKIVPPSDEVIKALLDKGRMRGF